MLIGISSSLMIRLRCPAPQTKAMSLIRSFLWSPIIVCVISISEFTDLWYLNMGISQNPMVYSGNRPLKDSNTLLRKWGGETGFPPLWCLNDFSADLHEILQELRFWSIISIRNFFNLKFFDFGKIFTIFVEFTSITDSKLTKTYPKPVQKRSRSHIAAKLVYTRHHPGSKHTGCVLCDC